MTTAHATLHSLPPPLELRDAGNLIGWIHGDQVRFRGFDSAAGASHAAAVAHLAVQRRLARDSRDGSSQSSTRSPDGRPAGHVLRSFLDVPADGDRDFAFDIRVPPPVDELRLRAMAYVMYRALRSSGVAWPLLRAA